MGNRGRPPAIKTWIHAQTYRNSSRNDRTSAYGTPRSRPREAGQRVHSSTKRRVFAHLLSRRAANPPAALPGLPSHRRHCAVAVRNVRASETLCNSHPPRNSGKIHAAVVCRSESGPFFERSVFESGGDRHPGGVGRNEVTLWRSERGPAAKSLDGKLEH